MVAETAIRLKGRVVRLRISTCCRRHGDRSRFVRLACRLMAGRWRRRYRRRETGTASLDWVGGLRRARDVPRWGGASGTAGGLVRKGKVSRVWVKALSKSANRFQTDA